jgi:hypothetical protein
VTAPARIVDAGAALLRVLALHAPDFGMYGDGGKYCRECSTVTGHPVPHPCPTRRVIDGGQP